MLIFLALALSIVAHRQGGQAFFYFIVLLSTTLIVELLAEFFIKYKIKFVWAYHIYVVIEYALLCFYYAATPGSTQKWPVKKTVPIFAVFSLYVSQSIYRFQEFPGININTSGLLLFVLYTHLLFSLNVLGDMHFYKQADFWISIGILLFFGGTFLFNAIYWPLLEMDEKKALELFAIINKPLNLLLYGCIIIGLLCSIPKKKYFTP